MFCRTVDSYASDPKFPVLEPSYEAQACFSAAARSLVLGVAWGGVGLGLTLGEGVRQACIGLRLTLGEGVRQACVGLRASLTSYQVGLRPRASLTSYLVGQGCRHPACTRKDHDRSVCPMSVRYPFQSMRIEVLEGFRAASRVWGCGLLWLWCTSRGWQTTPGKRNAMLSRSRHP